MNEAILTYQPTFQDTPLTISGDLEVVEDINDDLTALEQQLYAAQEASESSRTAKAANVARKAVKAATQPENGSQELYTLPTVRDRVATWIADRKLRQFDKLHDTDLYQQKQMQRRKTAIFLMASEAGLFDTAHDSYKRQLNRLAKQP